MKVNTKAFTFAESEIYKEVHKCPMCHVILEIEACRLPLATQKKPDFKLILQQNCK